MACVFPVSQISMALCCPSSLQQLRGLLSQSPAAYLSGDLLITRQALWRGSPGAGSKNKSAYSHPLSPAPHWWQFHERFQETDWGTGSIWRSWMQCFLCDFSIVTPLFLCRGKVGQLSGYKGEKVRAERRNDGRDFQYRALQRSLGFCLGTCWGRYLSPGHCWQDVVL